MATNRASPGKKGWLPTADDLFSTTPYLIHFSKEKSTIFEKRIKRKIRCVGGLSDESRHQERRAIQLSVRSHLFCSGILSLGWALVRFYACRWNHEAVHPHVWLFPGCDASVFHRTDFQCVELLPIFRLCIVLDRPFGERRRAHGRVRGTHLLDHLRGVLAFPGKIRRGILQP